MIVNLTRVNRFLALLVSVAVMFIILLGWIIHHENKLTNTANEQVQPAHIAAPALKQYHPAPASSPIAVQHMYTQLHTKQQQHFIQQVSNTQQNTSFDNGYQWAETHAVSNVNQCQSLPIDSIDGCKNFVETNQYLSQTTNI